ncbi:MAG: PqiC family protein [Methylococcaceae bacterium]|nr:PqiC family protein [Methylococcaceae bacterium]
MRLPLIVLLLLLAGGCSPKTGPAKFYLLQPLAQSELRSDLAGWSSPKIIGVGPIDLPAYLDRPQLVTGDGGAQLHLDEFQRWAEPLKDNFTRVLGENLSLQIPASHVMLFPWNRAIVPDYQVEVQVTRFHVDAAGNSELKANWNILRQNKPILMRQFQTRVQSSGENYEAKVAAQSRSVAALSREIVEALMTTARE